MRHFLTGISVVTPVNEGMGQSRLMSLVEAVANVGLGFVLAVLTQLAVLPWFGVRLTLGANMLLSVAFTVVSVVRAYALRRLFERLRTKWPIGSERM